MLMAAFTSALQAKPQAEHRPVDAERLTPFPAGEDARKVACTCGAMAAAAAPWTTRAVISSAPDADSPASGLAFSDADERFELLIDIFVDGLARRAAAG
jgi:hypothetical protein